LKKFPTSKSFRKMVKERYYKREFELLRSFKVPSSEPIDLFGERVEEGDESDNDEEDEDQAQMNETYQLLQKFQQLSKQQKTTIGKVHCSDPTYSQPWETTPLLQTNKGNKIVKLFYHCQNQKESKNGSRQEKIREYIHYGSNIYLANPDKVCNLPSFLEA